VQNDPFCDDPDIEEFLGYTGNEGTTSHDLEREVPLHHPEMSGRYHGGRIGGRSLDYNRLRAGVVK
jgi:hypothetical protein